MMTMRQMVMVVLAAFAGGAVGGVVSDQLWGGRFAQAEKPNAVNAEEFLLVDPSGKPRAGLGLDANGEIGLVLTSKDGSHTLRISPDDRQVIKLVERGGKVLWGMP
jgi:hypothetical protein